MRKPLRIWSDTVYVPDGLPSIGMLAPWFSKDKPVPSRLVRYWDVAPELFEMVDVAQADVAILPFNWEYTTWADAPFYPASRNMASDFHARAQAAGIPVVVFYETDVMREIDLEGMIVFGPSLRRSRRKPSEFAIPGWTEDLLAKYRHGHLDIRPKRDRPSIGFCGFAPPLAIPIGRTKMKESIRWMLHRMRAGSPLAIDPGPFVRAEAIRALRRSSVVDTDIIVRPYVVRPNRPSRESSPSSGIDALHGAPGGMGEGVTRGTSDEKASDTQLEFFENMIGNDYVLCARGFGNYSYRLYEALSCGRIPVFIDTDCVLPFDFDIDWKQHCVWVDERDVRSVGDRVAEFHASLSPDKFEEMQVAGRRLWEERLSPHGFFRHFTRHLEVTPTPGG